MLPIFVAADQFADVFAAGSTASPGDLLVDELLQAIGCREIFIVLIGLCKIWQGPRHRYGFVHSAVSVGQALVDHTKWEAIAGNNLIDIAELEASFHKLPSMSARIP